MFDFVIPPHPQADTDLNWSQGICIRTKLEKLDWFIPTYDMSVLIQNHKNR